MPKINRTDSAVTPRTTAAEGMSKSEQAAILKLIDGQKKGGADKTGWGPVPKYMVRPPAPDPGGVVAKYMVRPPVHGGGGSPIVAKYMVVPPHVVAKYMVVPPWAGVDAHQAVINKVTADGKLTKTEATLLRKLFNRDIDEASKDGEDIRGKVKAFLNSALDGVKMDKASKDLLYGPGGPGYTPVVAKYMVVPPKS